MELTSHIQGKNAKVRVYADRVEWETGQKISVGKLALGTMTAGLSLAATGVRSRKNAGSSMIPISRINSITSKRDSMINDKVSIITAGNTIEMRCSKSDAKAFKDLVQTLMLKSN
jgi:hypothetical protein